MGRTDTLGTASPQSPCGPCPTRISVWTQGKSGHERSCPPRRPLRRVYVRLPAQDRLSGASAGLARRRLARRAAGLAVPLYACPVLRDAVWVLQPLHPVAPAWRTNGRLARDARTA